MPLIALNSLNIVDLLKKDELVPDVFLEDGFSSSPSLLEITYPNGSQVVFGNSLSPLDTKQSPIVQFSPDDSSSTHYTLIMVDPDAPARHDRKFGYWRHWVVTNVVPSTTNTITISDHQGEQHTPYIGPGPGPDTGIHRYLFLLYKQSQHQDFPSMLHSEKEHRRHFDFYQFAKDHQLELVAFNYFLCSATQ
ncbi:phosphatidylethanolamine-binding protein [Halteromyces radiatus]|uniref:phosphatidylethanolamine-binding protein n=1 Tax=Halteromyces radiatus TaxID=101107 RepID=UPI0022207A11|nr:phosphatidylethanolamine-binding protein [Halteromyces radiatus]KAI8084679.1 phosphatidylethanolamine-binding protein [Halteromyces radiatus]